MTDAVIALLTRWRTDPNGSSRTWFLSEERVKSFRPIRRGILVVATRIEAGTFGNVFCGSALAAVVRLITEQGQVLKGLDCPFRWRPKTRTPDVYESADNQRAFGRLLDVSLRCTTERQIIAAIRCLDAAQIRGIGPAVANLMYFLRPTIVPLYNTAIVDGFNSLTGATVRPGSWADYLAMREGIMAFNQKYRTLLSSRPGGHFRPPLRPRPRAIPRATTQRRCRSARGLGGRPRPCKGWRAGNWHAMRNRTGPPTPTCRAGCGTLAGRWVSMSRLRSTTAIDRWVAANSGIGCLSDLPWLRDERLRGGCQDD